FAPLLRALTHTGTCGRIRARRFASDAPLELQMNEQEQVAAPQGAPDAPEGRREPKVIKRYTNRKLYDTVESRYVTLDEIAQMIKGDAEVKELDNRTKEDLSTVTLAQIIFEEEKKRSQMPLGVLREIIRHGGEAVAVFYQDKVGNRLSERLEEMKNRTEALRENIEQKVRGVTSLLRGSEEKGTSPVKEVLAAGQTAVEEFRAKVDQSVKQALDSFGSGAMAQEIEKLQRKIEALEKKLEQLGK